jgi:hypothetical protein
VIDWSNGQSIDQSPDQYVHCGTDELDRLVDLSADRLVKCRTGKLIEGSTGKLIHRYANQLSTVAMTNSSTDQLTTWKFFSTVD